MPTILVVDDLAANRQVLVTLLRAQGHTLLEAADGSEGLAVARADHPDLVITDVLMPVMDGYELVRQLRRDPTTRETPVVFHTAHYGAREARALALSNGVSYVLTKPADSDEVLRIIGGVLSGELETGIRPDASSFTTTFDREHLRLLTDTLSDKAGDLRTANARLRALINIGLELASERDADRLLEIVCVAARDLFSATYVTLGIVERNDRTVARFLSSGADTAGSIKAGDPVWGILGIVVAERRTLRGDNPGGDPTRLQLPALHPEVQAFLVAPIASPARVYGWMCLVGNEGRTFTEDDESLVLALAGQVGRLYELEDEIRERKRAESAVKQSGAEAERALSAAQTSMHALRTAEERTRYALEAAGVGIWDMDYTTGALRWSEILESQYGLQAGAFGGTFEEFVERVHPDDRRSVLATIGNAMKLGSDFSTLHRSILPDGTVRWLSGAGRIQIDEYGEPVRGVGISMDVTERHTLEAQYLQAQKMEAVGQLAGGVAHDFNNLLTAILGYCELVLADLDPGDRRREDIGEIQKAGLSAARLTRQLLAFSRKEIVRPTLLDMNAVVAEMRSMLGRLIGDDVNVVLDLEPDLANVKSDRGQVEQIIMNLAVNARDAMPGGGTLTIGTANVELGDQYAKTHLSVKPGPHVMLVVTDTGTGMTPEVQARLFEPFFTTKEPGKGTGLGLATVHGIVTRSGGHLSVDSEVGRGTSFKVYFPRAGPAETVVEAPTPADRPRRATQTVLVVEDADALRELTRRLLQRLGYMVLVAANADQAVRLFDRNVIDVLLTDVVMPGASGPELARRLVDRRPGLKVIYMSGSAEDVITPLGILAPGITLLLKPFTSEALEARMREVLDR